MDGGNALFPEQMNLRTSSTFYCPRQVIKEILGLIYPVLKICFPLPNVKTIDETIDKIKKDKSSIARYGDGEFLFIMDKIGYDYQKYDEILSRRLKEILKSDNENILIGLPVGYQSLANLNRRSQLTWKSHIVWTYPRLRKFLDMKKTYYNASFTRPFINFSNKTVSERYFRKVKELWQDRDIILVEGEKSRLGVGNDLFSNAGSLVRILGPARNAFTRYHELLNEIVKHDKTKLVLLALGSTATVLAFDLGKRGYQALDVGNIDIEYEWFLRGANSKVKIPGKYTNEAPGGREVEDIRDELYESQIIKRIL
ncbi:MAG: SP_1767 family glycosyltransferase [Acidobacteriota bacterium]|nr:SP_1767 family glycosyltransferase [Acidobacteriota bacterium]